MTLSTEDAERLIAETADLISRVRALVSRPALMTDDVRELAKIGANLCPRTDALALLLRATLADLANLQRQIDEACAVTECAGNLIELRDGCIEGVQWKCRAEAAEAALLADLSPRATPPAATGEVDARATDQDSATIPTGGEEG